MWIGPIFKWVHMTKYRSSRCQADEENDNLQKSAMQEDEAFGTLEHHDWFWTWPVPLPSLFHHWRSSGAIPAKMHLISNICLNVICNERFKIFTCVLANLGQRVKELRVICNALHSEVALQLTLIAHRNRKKSGKSDFLNLEQRPGDAFIFPFERHLTTTKISAKADIWPF